MPSPRRQVRVIAVEEPLPHRQGLRQQLVAFLQAAQRQPRLAEIVERLGHERVVALEEPLEHLERLRQERSLRPSGQRPQSRFARLLRPDATSRDRRGSRRVISSA